MAGASSWQRGAWLGVVAAGLVCGQTTSAMEGTVSDPSGAAVVGARLEITETRTAESRQLSTDGAGRYLALRLAPGIYQVAVSYAGFPDQMRRDLELGAGARLRVDLVLHLGPAQERIEVIAEAPLVSASAAGWGGSLRQDQLGSLPLNGRDLFELSLQEPGAALSREAGKNVFQGLGIKVSVHGARPSQNSFQVDGIYINDASASAPAGAAGALVGVEAIAELRVVTSPFSAEYGRAAGGVFTAVSKSGSNQRHGSLYEFWRNSALDARDFFAAPGQDPPPFKRNQFGGLLGGPVRRNRLFFLGNYEGVRERLSDTVRLTVPTAAARQGILPVEGGGTRTVALAPQVLPYLDLYPLPNGRDFGDGTAEFINQSLRSTREDYLTGKLDLLVSPRLRQSGRYSFDDGDRGAPDPLQIWRFATQTRYQLAYAETQHIISPKTIQAFRAGFSRVRSAETSQTRAGISPSLRFVPGQGLGSMQVAGLSDFGGSLARQRPRQHVFNNFLLNDDLVQVRGAHTLRLGAGCDRIRFNQIAEMSAIGHYQFGSLADFLQGQPRQGEVMLPGSDAARGWRQNQLYAYFQDEFRATSRLSLSLGLRYEVYSTPWEVNGKIATLRDPAHDASVTIGAPVFRNPSYDNFAPRAALAWDLSGSLHTVLRAGAGIFFDLIGTRELIAAGVRMPPFYNRVVVTKPLFPNLLESVRGAAAGNTTDGLDYYLNQPYTGQFQLTLERQLSPVTLLRLCYAGTRGIHLIGPLGNANPTRPQILSDGRLFFPADGARVNPAFGQIGLRRTQFNSWYHGLSAGLERRWRGGLRFQGNYTWSKSIDETSNTLYTDADPSDLIPVMFNYRQNRGLSDFDLRHAFNANASWRISPWGSSLGAKLLGGWEIHGMARLQTGEPFAPAVGFDRARLLPARGDLGQRPDFSAAPGARVILGDPARYFDPLVFSLPPAGFYGNLGRGTLRGPGLLVLDLALHKVIWQREQRSVRIRLECFNASNHPNFRIPSDRALFDSTSARLGTAGRITDTSTAARQIQIAARWEF